MESENQLHAGMENVGLGRSSPGGWAILSLLLAGLCKSCESLWRLNLWGKALSMLPALITLFIAQAIIRDLLKPVPPPQHAS